MFLLRVRRQSTLDHIPSEAAPMVPQGNDRIRRINEIEFEIPDEKQDLVHPYGTSTIPLMEYEKGLPSIPNNICAGDENKMFKLKLGNNNRKARYDDSDQFELTENLENLVDDLEKNKCFGIQEVIDVDMSLDDYNAVVIECKDPVLIQKIEDTNGDTFTGDSVKVVIRVDDGSLILTVETEEDGEANEYDFIDLGRAYGVKYSTLLSLVKDGISQILN